MNFLTSVTSSRCESYASLVGLGLVVCAVSTADVFAKVNLGLFDESDGEIQEFPFSGSLRPSVLILLIALSEDPPLTLPNTFFLCPLLGSSGGVLILSFRKFSKLMFSSLPGWLFMVAFIYQVILHIYSWDASYD